MVVGIVLSGIVTAGFYQRFLRDLGRLGNKDGVGGEGGGKVVKGTVSVISSYTSC